MPAPASPPTDFPSYYAQEFARCTVLPCHMSTVLHEAAIIRANLPRYMEVTRQHFPAMPALVVGVIHSLECGLRFDLHLHNGDPLTARTKSVPKGRPIAGKPPFTWEQSAIDALKYDGFDKVTNWSLGHMLDALERYNGLGYRKRGIPSPYLWSMSDRYTQGKFTSDGKFDPQAVSEQPGAAALLKILLS